MRNFWLVAKHEYGRIVVRRAFIILTLAIPLGLAVLIALAVVIETGNQSKLPVGYVDIPNILDESVHAQLPDAEDRIPVREFSDEEAALAALNREEIQAFFVLPADYLETLETDLAYLERPPSGGAWRDFDRFVRLNLLASLPGDVQQRLFNGPDITVRDIVSQREFGENSFINILLPFIATFFFFIATMSASGYMLQVVTEEKENRTMEIMLTSTTPGQLIGGKASGLLAAALTQLAIYVVTAVIGVIIATPYVEPLQHITIPWSYLGIVTLFFFPAYVLSAAVMLAIGSAVTELQQGQQVAGILNLFFMLPLFLLATMFQNPGAPLIVFFSLFPTTAFLTISLRWGLGTVPLWQIGTSWIILTASALFMMWAATRIFRAGMLRYGQPLSLKRAFAAVRGN